MPRGGANRKPTAARQRYFELVRQGLKGAAAARQVGVSTSCGSKWFIEAGSMIIPDASVAPRFLTQDDRIAIADGDLHRTETLPPGTYSHRCRNCGNYGSDALGRFQRWLAHLRAHFRARAGRHPSGPRNMLHSLWEASWPGVEG
jgi:hypothetical protein